MKRILLASWCACAAAAAWADQDPAVRTYTNEDLDRVRPYRGETGVASRPAPTLEAQRARPARGPRGVADHGEAYWRREAERHREQVAGLRRQLAALDERVAERRRRPGVRPYSDPIVRSTQARAESLRARIRESEARFEDRARREGALPGWLR